MLESLTPGASRALARALSRAEDRSQEQPLCPFDLFLALLDDSDSRAFAVLEPLSARPLTLPPPVRLDAGNPAEATGELGQELSLLPKEIRSLLVEAQERARRIDRVAEVGTEHLLSALAATDARTRAYLDEHGISYDSLLNEFEETIAVETAPIALAAEIRPLELTTPGEGPDLARILDASANRAREAFRVVEDYARFVLDDPGLTRRLKDCRHRLGEATRVLDEQGHLIGARDTRGDVGTHIMTPGERVRENPRAVLTANFKRAGEALRSLEEYTKLFDHWLAGRFEVLRYDCYTLEKLMLTAVSAQTVLGDARLYFLAGGRMTLRELLWQVGEALSGGVQVVQLREKGIADREFLTRARELRLLVAEHRAHLIVNDRPDLARLSGAHGVHLGQDDMTVRDARRIMGPHAQIGVSTHNSEQIKRAILEGASYLGVGPVFSSMTKDFGELAGLAHVRSAAETTNCPWFAIGGITLENLAELLDAGARRVAVSAAIARAERPREAAKRFRERLDAASES